jgi:XTP/dITP diphosphohydrolase
MRKLVFATNNPHKLEEIREITGDKFQILSLEDIGCREEIEETATTIEGNASLKANYIAGKYATDCFADDTGLEIMALGGRPGVKSARYAGDDCIPDNNIRKLLGELEGIEDRRARFRTVISLIMDGKEVQFEGVVEGEIIREKKGKDGFGYDPVFLPEGYNLTFAEMPSGLKNSISHRGRAMARLIDYLMRSASFPKKAPSG